MVDDEEIIKNQIDLLNQAVSILNDRILKIEGIAKNRKYSSKDEASIRSIIDIFETLSLKLYKDILYYITQEVGRNDPIHFFLLPHIRTLLDIYGRLIYILDKRRDESLVALTCLSCQLIVSKAIKSEKNYLELLKLAEDFLTKVKFSFPSFSIFSKKWVGNNHLKFPKTGTLITEENVKKYSINVFTIFNTKEPHNIYSGFSEYIHGNPYYYKEKPLNEQFWVISQAIWTTAFLLEMIDSLILKKNNSSDFQNWLNQIKKSKPDFIKLWHKKRILQAKPLNKN